jgi:hypothetical protein
MHLKILALIASALVLAACEFAQSDPFEVTLEWELPTEYEDGSPLAPDEIEETVIQWGESAEGPWPNTHRVAGPATQTTLTAQTEGSCGTIYIGATVLATNGLYSEPSNTVTYEVDCRPNPPTDLRVVQ